MNEVQKTAKAVSLIGVLIMLGGLLIICGLCMFAGMVGGS